MQYSHISRQFVLLVFVTPSACLWVSEFPDLTSDDGAESTSSETTGSSGTDTSLGLNAEDDLYILFQQHDEAPDVMGPQGLNGRPGLLDNDTASPDAVARFLSNVTARGWGHTIEEDGTVTYDRDPSFWGLDDFRYSLIEADGTAVLGDAHILVRPERILLDEARAKGFGSILMTGEITGDELGSSIAGIGDFNGDGLEDIAVGAPSHVNAAGNVGRCYVIFGTSTPHNLDLRDLAAEGLGFVINGEDIEDRACHSVAGLGDLNGDGKSDLIIGAPKAGPSQGGRAYVVYGRSGVGPIELSNVAGGSDGFVIESEDANDELGWTVASAGDVDGDERQDILVTARSGHDAGIGPTGRAYVVMGVEDPTTVYLSDVVTASGGFAIFGEAVGDRLGTSAIGAVDVNGDGLDDVILGAPGANLDGDDTGRVYVVFGKENDLSSVSLANIPDDRGFAINGANSNDDAGTSVSALRDMNGDGCDEIVVGVQREAGEYGVAYVVFGKDDGVSVLLGDVEAGSNIGYRLEATEAGDLAGSIVAAVGDFDGDELEDLAIGAPLADSPVTNRPDVGSAHIIYGTIETTSSVTLDDTPNGNEGFLVVGEDDQDIANFVVNGAGDFNGDKLDDLLIGTPNWSKPGAIYILFGVPSQLTQE